MSRGLGDTQRALLSELAASEDLALTTAELAMVVHRGPRQVRTAVESLVRRGLVVTTLGGIDWKGEGEYGSLTYGHNRDDVDMGPPAGIIRKGEHLLHSTRLAREDIPYWHQGMPTFGLYVWLPVNRARHLNAAVGEVVGRGDLGDVVLPARRGRVTAGSSSSCGPH
jgi:hypothetical protein